MLYGVKEDKIGQLVCECRKKEKCDKAGKHPRFGRGYRTLATLDPLQISMWLQKYPNANTGTMMGRYTFALDADFNPALKKDGPNELKLFEEHHGQRISETITTISGRNELSWHRFFLLPDEYIGNFRSPSHAVELIKNGYTVTPGSRHLSGNYYHFADGCSPYDREVVKLPAFVLDALRPPPRPIIPFECVQKINGHYDLSLRPEGAVEAGKLRPDWAVLKYGIWKDHVACPLFWGHRTSLNKKGLLDRSKDDYIYFSKLSFYTAHNWEQYVRLAVDWFNKWGTKNNVTGDYLTRTLYNAFAENDCNWSDKRMTGNGPGRKLSLDTIAVMNTLTITPDRPSIEIARELGIDPSKVRVIRSRIEKRSYKKASNV